MTGGIRLRLLLAAIASLLGLTVCAHAQVPANPCSLGFVTRLPLNESTGWFTTTVRINDHPVIMLVDTGAAHTAISPELAKQLRLPQDRRTRLTVHGVGGNMKAAHPVIAHSFQAGKGHLVDYELMVANISGPSGKDKPDAPEGVLGLDLLSYYELEFDFPNRTLALYTPSNCSGNFVPWTGRFDVIAGKRQLDGQLFIPVSVNRQAINAVIDTGATRTALGIDTAHDVGVSEAELRMDRPASTVGANGVPVRTYQHRFDSFTVGQTTFHRVPLFIDDERRGVIQMLLGMDFFRRRKLWVSFKTEQIFLQYTPLAREQHALP